MQLLQPRATNLAATVREVLAEFRDSSGKRGGELAHGDGSSIRVWSVSLRRESGTALARRQRGKAHAAGGRGAAHAGRAGAGTRHQAGAVRPRLGRHGGGTTTLSPPASRSCAARSATTPGTRIPSRPGTGAATASWCRRHRSSIEALRPASLYIAPEPLRLVGRFAELELLARHFDQARSGRRQLVFVTGEPGIGKSSLADAFLEQLQTARAAKIAHGQCLDHHGAGEPYLPLIEALTRLAEGRDGRGIKEILSAQAPSWLAQMPSL